MKPPSDFHPGDIFAAERTCDRYRPIYYAAVSGDFNPLHLDPEVARLAGLPGVVLHGMCTLSWLAEACVRWLDDPGRLARISARFAKPVFPGDTLRLEGCCLSLAEGRAVLGLRAVNQRGEEVLKGASAEARLAAAVGTAPAAERTGPGEGSGPGEPPAGLFASAVGRRYGPYAYAVGLEELRDFAVVLAGGVPGRVFAGAPPEEPHPLCVDEAAARAGPHGGLVGFPTACVRFALEPFARACIDPSLGVNLTRLLHGEQAFEFGVPFRPGDRLTTTGTIVEARARPKMDLFTLESTTTRADGALVVRGRWTAVVRS